MATAEVNGFFMHHLDTGGAMSPVVFVHGGFPSLATIWETGEHELEEWEQRIAADHRLITFARRGYHPSACPKDGFEIPTQATDIAALMDRLGVDAAHVIGSSAGGPISYCLAARFSRRVRSLVLVGTGLNLRRTLRDHPQTMETLRREVEALHQLGPLAASDRRPPRWAVSFDALFMAAEFAGRGEGAVYDERLARQRQLLDTVPPETRAQFHSAEIRAIEAYLAWDGTDEAASVACPTLVMHGIDDRAITVKEGAELARLIPNARFETFNATHSLLWRHEPALLRALDFIAEVDKQRIPYRST